jgi:hypothetical protein
MDLNKPISLSFSFEGLDIANAKLPFLVSVSAVIGIFILGFLSFNAYGNYEVHNASKTQFEALSQQKITLQHQREKMLKEHADQIESLAKSPQSKSELAALLSGLLTKNGLKLSKLNSNDVAPGAGGKDAAIELEADGQFQGIKSFLKEARVLVLASDVIHLKINKSKDARALHLSLAVKFTQAPKLSIPKNNVAFIINGNPYLYDTFDRWQMRRAGFVQAPEAGSSEQTKETVTPTTIDAKRNDPFSSPPQPFTNKEGVNPIDPSMSQAPVKKANVMFLSGIIYSANGKFCIVVLPSGESKVFTEGEKVNAKITIGRISDESVTFLGTKKTNQFKVGQELSL